jgi:ceramide synthetase
MFIHHNVTIALIGLSWTAHFTRVGTLIILVHDCSDHLLELAKMLKYTGYQKTCDIFFVLFAVTWIVTRCGIFPFWILRSTLFDAGTFVQLFPLYYVFLILLGLLQVLNLVWTFMLVKAIWSAIKTGEAEDNRSDSEPSSEDENDNDWKKKN